MSTHKTRKCQNQTLHFELSTNMDADGEINKFWWSIFVWLLSDTKDKGLCFLTLTSGNKKPYWNVPKSSRAIDKAVGHGQVSALVVASVNLGCIHYMVKPMNSSKLTFIQTQMARIHNIKKESNWSRSIAGENHRVKYHLKSVHRAKPYLINTNKCQLAILYHQ